jgi:hypothetical protein
MAARFGRTAAHGAFRVKNEDIAAENDGERDALISGMQSRRRHRAVRRRKQPKLRRLELPLAVRI